MAEEFSIHPYLQNAEILQLTAEQIKKDFSFFDLILDIENIALNEYDLIYRQVLQQIKKLLSASSQKIYALLYRIDISEAQLKKEAQQHQEQAPEEIITHLIIKRCLQKVVLRKLYSTHD